MLASNTPRIQATFRNRSDLYLLGEDGYLPVTKFLNGQDTASACETMHLTTGEAWTIPIIFPISAEKAAELKAPRRPC